MRKTGGQERYRNYGGCPSVLSHLSPAAAQIGGRHVREGEADEHWGLPCLPGTAPCPKDAELGWGQETAPARLSIPRPALGKSSQASAQSPAVVTALTTLSFSFPRAVKS